MTKLARAVFLNWINNVYVLFSGRIRTGCGSTRPTTRRSSASTSVSRSYRWTTKHTGRKWISTTASSATTGSAGMCWSPSTCATPLFLSILLIREWTEIRIWSRAKVYLYSRLASKALKPKKFRIKVVSGQFLPKPSGDSSTSELIDPYVIVEIIGLDVDSKTVS